MKIRKNDTVKILSGKDKGKEAKVTVVMPRDNKVVVEGVNIVKKHIKPGRGSKEGGIVSVEKPIDSSNVILICSNCNKATRVGFKESDGKKYRVCKKCGNTI